MMTLTRYCDKPLKRLAEILQDGQRPPGALTPIKRYARTVESKQQFCPLQRQALVYSKEPSLPVLPENAMSLARL